MRLKLILILAALSSLSFFQRSVKKYVPPGTVPITQTFFADQHEITNFAWIEYELWIANKYGKKTKQHLDVLPDTLVWKKEYNKAFTEIYYRHPNFRNYPVVGLTYEQTMAYCQWRTERVKESYYHTHQKEINLEFRLPTKTEWEFISNNGSEVYNKKNSFKCVKYTKDTQIYNINYKANCYINDTISQFTFTKPVASYNKNHFKIFDMIGNVSEMISEKGISKGGSWQSSLEESRVGKDIPFSKPEAWLGFRCVCIIK